MRKGEKTIQVTVNPLYPLDKRVRKGSYQFPEGTVTREAVRALGFSDLEIKEMRVAVDGVLVSMNWQLEDHCTIVLIPTLAGG